MTTPPTDPSTELTGLAISNQPPDGVDPGHWARLCTADDVRAYSPGKGLAPHVRHTVEGLLRPTCHDIRARVEEVIDTAVRDRESFARTWLALRAEWDIRARLLTIEITTDHGDELTLTERRDGHFSLSVTQPDADHGIGHAVITIPAKKMYDLAAAVSIHASPVPRPTTSTTATSATDRTETP